MKNISVEIQNLVVEGVVEFVENEGHYYHDKKHVYFYGLDDINNPHNWCNNTSAGINNNILAYEIKEYKIYDKYTLFLLKEHDERYNLLVIIKDDKICKIYDFMDVDLEIANIFYPLVINLNDFKFEFVYEMTKLKEVLQIPDHIKLNVKKQVINYYDNMFQNSLINERTVRFHEDLSDEHKWNNEYVFHFEDYYEYYKYKFILLGDSGYGDFLIVIYDGDKLHKIKELDPHTSNICGDFMVEMVDDEIKGYLIDVVCELKRIK